MHITGWAFFVVALALFVGAILQGVIGFGMIVLAFPVLIMVEPILIPQTTLICAFPMVFVMAWRSRGHSDWPEVGWFSLGRIPGYVGALVILSMLSRSQLTLLGGISVLIAVTVSLWAPAIKRTKAALLIGGSISALFGTAMGIGGPPIGILYQNETGQRLRSTVSLQMLFGAPASLAILLIAGKVDGTDLRTGLALLPFSLGGNYTSKWVIPHFDQRLRPLILTVCGLAAVFAIGRVLLG